MCILLFIFFIDLLVDLYVSNLGVAGMQVLCCDGHIRAAKAKYDVECCGQDLFDSEKEVCCNGVILTPGLKCCNDGNYVYIRSK